MKGSNLIARQVSRLRYQRGWTQDELAELLQGTGWLISRSGVSKIEGGSIYVPDFRLVWLASVFKVQVSDLLPQIDWRAPVVETLGKYIDPEKLTPPSKLLLPVSFNSTQLTADEKIPCFTGRYGRGGAALELSIVRIAARALLAPVIAGALRVAPNHDASSNSRGFQVSPIQRDHQPDPC